MRSLRSVSVCAASPLSAGEIDALLPLLDDEDEPGVLRPAVRLLEDQPLERSISPASTSSPRARSRSSSASRFRSSAASTPSSVVKTLIGYLTDDSYARRDQATATLKSLPAARLPLMKELLACEDERKAWTIADIVLLHDRGWKRDTVGALWDKLQTALEKREDRLYAALHHVLNALDPAWLHDADPLPRREVAQGAALPRKRPLARRCCSDTPAWDDEARYAFGLAALKSHKRSAGADRAPRRCRGRNLPRPEQHRPFRSPSACGASACCSPRISTSSPSTSPRNAATRAASRASCSSTSARNYGRTKVGKAAKNKLQLVAGLKEFVELLIRRLAVVAKL